MTAEFTINYVRPAQGTALVARTTATVTAGQQALCRCEIGVIADGQAGLVALAQGTIIARMAAGV